MIGRKHGNADVTLHKKIRYDGVADHFLRHHAARWKPAQGLCPPAMKKEKKDKMSDIERKQNDGLKGRSGRACTEAGKKLVDQRGVA